MPESQLWEAVFKAVLGAGGVAVLLFFGVWWLNKNNNGLILELKEERNNRIKLLESEAETCKLDRVELHRQINVLQGQIIDIYKSRDAKVVAAIQAGALPN